MLHSIIRFFFTAFFVFALNVPTVLAHAEQEWLYPGARCQLRGDFLRKGETANLGVSQFGYISNICNAKNQSDCPTLQVVCPIDRGAIFDFYGIDVDVKFSTRFVTNNLSEGFHCSLINIGSNGKSSYKLDTSTLADIAETEPGKPSVFELSIGFVNTLPYRKSNEGGGYMLTCSLPPIRQDTTTKLIHYVVKEYVKKCVKPICLEPSQ